jgi:hypothetical protein
VSRRKGFAPKRGGTFAGARPARMPHSEVVCATPGCTSASPNVPLCWKCRQFLTREQIDALGSAFRALRSERILDEGGNAASVERRYRDLLAKCVRVVIEGQMRLDEEKWAA